jgi:hypothetical protein
MATIYSLNQSITDMSEGELLSKLHLIRENRRRKPERAMRQKSTPAKVARAPKKSNLKPTDMFQFARGLSDEAKAKLAAELLGGLK